MDDTVSVVVIVKNDLGVRDTVDHLITQRESLESPVEIIVIDSSTDERVRDLSRRYGAAVSWLPFRNTAQVVSKRSTIPQQRNMGVLSSHGSIVVFIDASCIPCIGWLASLIRPLLYEGEHIVAGPAIPSSASDENWLMNNMRKTINGRTYLHEAATINIGIKRCVFDSVGLFDESFLYGSDIDFSVRAIAKGYPILFVPEATVTHDWGSFRGQLRRPWRYAEARVRFYKKNPNLWKRLFSSDFVTLAYPLFILLLPLVVVFPYVPLLLVLPLVKNARNRPLKTVLMNLWYGFCVLINVIRFASGIHS